MKFFSLLDHSKTEIKDKILSLLKGKSLGFNEILMDLGYTTINKKADEVLGKHLRALEAEGIIDSKLIPALDFHHARHIRKYFLKAEDL